MLGRPRLVERFRRQDVVSPTSTLGYVLAVLFSGVIAVGASAALLAFRPPGRWTPLLLVPAWLLLLARSLRDAWSWLAAPDGERAAFRAEVESLRRWTPPHGYAPIFDANTLARAAWALLLAAAGAAVALARWYDAILVPLTFAAAFLLGGGRDLLRRGRAPRRVA
jgi:hypothetical protein